MSLTQRLMQIPGSMGLAVMALLALLVSLAGCDSGVLSGVHDPYGGKRKADITYRLEYELVTEAQLLREDTSPEWQLGRFAFKRGVDNLLVISHLASYPRMDPKGKTVVERYDQTLERVWITLPLGTEVGQTLKIENLESQFLTGYDVGEISSGKMYAMPHKLMGKITIMDNKDDAIVLGLDIGVEPTRLLTWGVNDRVQVPKTRNGLRATMAQTPYEALAEQTPATQRPGTEITPLPPGNPGNPGTPGVTPGTPGVEPTGPRIGPITPEIPGATGSSGTGEPNTAGPGVLASQVKTAVGQWTAKTPRYEYRFQFNPDGTFIYASTRTGGSFAPGMKYGTWEERDNYLTLKITRYEIDGQDHMKFIDVPLLALKQTWKGSDMLLTGDLRDREGEGTLQLDKTTYPDMAKTLPPRGGQPEAADPAKAQGADPANPASPEVADIRDKVIGRWFGNVRGYDVHLQIDADGRFVLTSGRATPEMTGQFPPGMRYGRWKTKDTFLILDVAKFVFENRNVDHMPYYKGQSMLIFKVDPKTTELELTGAFRHPLPEEKITFTLKAKQFPDLHSNRPKNNRAPGYDVVREPTFKEIIYRDGDAPPEARD